MRAKADVVGLYFNGCLTYSFFLLLFLSHISIPVHVVLSYGKGFFFLGCYCFVEIDRYVHIVIDRSVLTGDKNYVRT